LSSTCFEPEGSSSGRRLYIYRYGIVCFTCISISSPVCSEHTLLLDGCLTVHLPHEIRWNANLMQLGNFIDVFLAQCVSGTYAQKMINKNTSIKWPSCIKLAFHFISQSYLQGAFCCFMLCNYILQCTVQKHNSSYLSVFTRMCHIVRSTKLDHLSFILVKSYGLL